MFLLTYNSSDGLFFGYKHVQGIILIKVYKVLLIKIHNYYKY